MVIRVAVRDMGAAESLIQEFVRLFADPCVSLRAGGEIQIEHAPDKALLRVLDAVERHLEKSGVSTASVWVDDRPYMLERSVLPEPPAARRLQLIPESA